MLKRNECGICNKISKDDWMICCDCFYKEVVRNIEKAKEQGRRELMEKNKVILEFIYARLIGVHNENASYDYMIAFKKAIKESE